MYLRSGDILTMSRDTRLAYHAVPRILRDQRLDNLLTQDSESQDKQGQTFQHLEIYLSYSRINVNIRQVEGPSRRFSNQDEVK